VAIQEGAQNDSEVLDGFAMIANELKGGLFANDTLAMHLTDEEGQILNSYQ
jgi:hypothetical protein